MMTPLPVLPGWRAEVEAMIGEAEKKHAKARKPEVQLYYALCLTGWRAELERVGGERAVLDGWGDMTTTLLQGDCREVLATLPERSVQCCVTSPPYFGLRRYDVEGAQIGMEQTPAEYVAALVEAFLEVKRVLRDDGTLWVNLGDSYAGSWGNYAPGGIKNQQRPQTEEGRRWERKAYGDTTTLPATARVPGLAEKNLIGIPWRVAFALQDSGWILRSDIIWHKPNPMPESVTDRPTRAHEYLFLFAKQPRYFYDADAVREPHGKPRKSGPNALRGQVEIRPRGNGQSIDEQSYHLLGRNKRTVWTVATTTRGGAHFAVFPEQLIEPCIKAGSRPGDIVLDPFVGSGTTCRVAESLGRNSIGIDLGYQELQEKRTDGVQVRMEAYL